MGWGSRVGVGLLISGLVFKGWVKLYTPLSFCSRGGLRAPRPARKIHDGSPAAAPRQPRQPRQSRQSRPTRNIHGGGPAALPRQPAVAAAPPKLHSESPAAARGSPNTNTQATPKTLRKEITRKTKCQKPQSNLYLQIGRGKAARLPDVYPQVCSAIPNSKSCLWACRWTLRAHTRRMLKRQDQK